MYEEPDLIQRTVRDFLTEDVTRILVDDEEEAKRIREMVGLISSRSQRKIISHKDPTPLFERLDIEKQIDSAFGRKVELPSGGYIVIDEAEALVAIDVNTGRARGGREQGGAIFQTNMEAAREVARQLRLRNIGGLIVIDFIDMKTRREGEAVVQRLKECVRRDKARIHILSMSEFGLVEMTRQRVQESIRHSLYVPCPTCHGRGMVKSPETMSVEIQRAIVRAMRLHPEIKELRVLVHPSTLERLKTEDEELLLDLERRLQGKLFFRPDAHLGAEQFTLLNAITGAEIT